jgi:predicted ferric reductase
MNLINIFATNTSVVISHRLVSSWPWYIIRGAGFAAAAILILLMLSGIGQVTGILYRWIEPVKLWTIHKALGIAFLVAIAFHGGFLLIDHYVHFNIIQILLPFASKYNNGTTLFGLHLGGIGVTLGILAMYGAVAIVLSSLFWIDSKKKTWKLLHYLSYFVMTFVFVHALTVGTDLKYGFFRAIWILATVLIIVAIIIRLWRAGTMSKKT